TNFLPCYLRRDKTSMRYQTHYQLKQKAVVRAFRKSSSDWRIGGNELIHSDLFQVYHLGFGSS
ncbi:hypothetical protein RLL46_07100, partial [Streptococcus pneumoniae]|nr:hypothetical protein [Streptococcus pneumoniae]MDS2445358.1 hypothetical protein [Streptococcus pneumoniae]MDS2549355.1 hypothetical protein [Streptococcus pneumoniae]MDS3094661.1 hypothetical protein [Streptococcus pneumoniae]MDS3525794.1 hypothetical protein [Streptococcus pneumoniae]